LLHHGRYVNTPIDVLEKSLTGTMRFATEEQSRSTPDFNVFHRYAANFPWRSHALWFLSQMKRWGQLDSEFTPEDIARSVYQPEVYREAARKLGIAAPDADTKTEGRHAQSWQLEGFAIELGADRFMDHREFDANDFNAYVESFEIRHVIDADNSIADQAV
jgi:nitrate/nitrite transport system substrate-binding protein